MNETILNHPVFDDVAISVPDEVVSRWVAAGWVVVDITDDLVYVEDDRKEIEHG